MALKLTTRESVELYMTRRALRRPEFTDTELNETRNRIEDFRRMAREWEETDNREMVKCCLNEAREIARAYGIDEETI